jgi:ATP-dependent Clp protease ATP-binding subunit ClpX
MRATRVLPKILTPREIYQELDRFVIGQTKAKKAVAIAAYNHLKRVRARAVGMNLLGRKSNILLIGPTGCGKTHIARTLANILSVPFVVADATEYTEAGYYGKDVEVMIGELLMVANMDVSMCERGIVFIDEVDKIARRSHSASTGAGNRDIGGEGVQQALLKMLEGRTVLAPSNLTQHWSKYEYVPIDTTDILFICAGTFSDLFMYSGEGKRVGFVSDGERGRRRKITEQDLLKYGLIAEFLGRLPVRVQMEPLSDMEMLEILVKPPDSLVNEYTEMLRLDGVHLEFEQSGLIAIVQEAKRRDGGARALRAVMEEVLQDVLFHGPDLCGRSVTVDRAFVEFSLKRNANQ